MRFTNPRPSSRPISIFFNADAGRLGSLWASSSMPSSLTVVLFNLKPNENVGCSSIYESSPFWIHVPLQTFTAIATIASPSCKAVSIFCSESFEVSFDFWVFEGERMWTAAKAIPDISRIPMNEAAARLCRFAPQRIFIQMLLGATVFWLIGLCFGRSKSAVARRSS